MSSNIFEPCSERKIVQSHTIRLLKKQNLSFATLLIGLGSYRHDQQDHQIGLEGKRPSETFPSCATLETYEETPIFISVDITEEAVELVTQNLLGSFGPGSTDSEALQGWLLNFGEGSTRLSTSVENFIDWLVNGSPPRAAYCAFISGRLISIDKQPDVSPVSVGET